MLAPLRKTARKLYNCSALHMHQDSSSSLPSTLKNHNARQPACWLGARPLSLP